MNEHLHIHKNTGFQTASQPKQSQFQSRPFVVQPQTEEQSSQPDLKTALQRAERYGHRLDRIKFSEAPAPAQVRRIVQAKLTIGEPGDRYEQEADRVAAQVVDSIHAPSSHRSELNQAVQRQEEPEAEIQAKPNVSDLMRSPLPTQVQREAKPEDEELQTKSILQRREAIEGGEASTDVESAINSAKGGGQPLEAGLQQSMGQAMGADFSKVKIHTDAQADQLNQSIQARAFTTGQDVFFRSGEYNPGSRGGQELIAHELTHVVQQNGGAVQRSHLNSPQQLSASASKAGMGLVQRALVLNISKKLSWDDKGNEKWNKNESAPSPIAQHINKLVKEGVLNATYGDKFVSGHAIAAAFGGENHERNIVGWDETNEHNQTELEWAVQKGQQTTYTNAKLPQPGETGELKVQAQLYGEDGWSSIQETWATTLKNHVVANWDALKANKKVVINPKIPADKQKEIAEPSEDEILEGIKKSLKAGGHPLERVKRIPQDYQISYAPTSATSAMTGRNFVLKQVGLPTVQFNASAAIGKVLEYAKLPKASAIVLGKYWFLYSETP